MTTSMVAGDRGVGDLFDGPGEVRALARTLDWGRTPLGWPDAWSPALRVATRAMLDAPFPICLWSGPEYALVYNDAYRRILAAKHPAALGRPGSEVWAEIWADLRAQFDQVRAGGPPLQFDDARFEMARLEGGGVEEAFFSYSLSALRDEDGSVAAVLNISPETSGRVKAERALGVERARLEQVFRRAPSFIVAFRGPEQVYEFVNEAYYQLVGHREIIGKPLLEAIPEIREQGFKAVLDRVRETGEPWVGLETPVQLQRTPGAALETRFLDMVFQPLTDADGARAGVVVHGNDVTAHVLARHEVERARDRADRLLRLTAALAAATTVEEVAEVVVAQGVASAGATTAMLSLRQPAADGEGPEEVVTLREHGLAGDVMARYGRVPLDSPTPTATGVRSGAASFHEDGVTLRAAFPAIPEAFDRVGAQSLATVPLVVGGEVIGAMTFTFTTPRAFPPEEREVFLAFGRQAAQALERARLIEAERRTRVRSESLQRVTARLAGAQSMADVGRVFSEQLTSLIGVDTAWVGAVTADRRAVEALGASGYADGAADRWRRIPIEEPIALTDAVRERRAQWWPTREALAAAYPERAAIIRALAQDGVAVLPLVAGGDGDAIGAIVVGFLTPQPFDADTRDFFLALAQQCTQALLRARAYEAEQAARREAEAANRAKSQFLATMSHELRTPLNAIAGYAQLLELGVHGPVTPEQRHAVERIQRSQRALLVVINEVLNYARVEVGAVTYDLRPTPLADAVAGATPLVEPQCAAKRLALDVRMPDPREAPVVLADGDKLQQILLNLLSNAVKFTPEGGRVGVEVAAGRDAQGRARLRVTDTGVGIPADQLEAIFEPFVQVGRTLNNPAEGTGLGLAIARDLARGMGGELSAESVVGEGSAFTLALPRA